MLPTTLKIKEIDREIIRLMDFAHQVKRELESLKREDNLTQKIGCFLTTKKSQYEFVLLAEEYCMLVNLIRYICTGEILPMDGITYTKRILKELNAIAEGIQVAESRIRSE